MKGSPGEVLLDRLPREPVFDERLRDSVSTRVDPDLWFAGSPRTRVLVCVGRTPVDAGVIARHPRLQAVICLGSGSDHVDHVAAAGSGVQIRSQRAPGARAVAEHALGMMLALRRRFLPMDAGVRAGEWERWKACPADRGLDESVLSVLGFGAIGRELVRKVRASFDTEIRVWSPTVDQAEITAAGAQPVPDLSRALEQADSLSIHLPLTPQTSYLIGIRELMALAAGGVVINTSRGGIVDERALAEALASGHLSGAGLDVLSPEPPPDDHPLLQAPNVLLTPHRAGLTIEADRRRHVAAAEDVLEVLGRVPATGSEAGSSSDRRGDS